MQESQEIILGIIKKFFPHLPHRKLPILRNSPSKRRVFTKQRLVAIPSFPFPPEAGLGRGRVGALCPRAAIVDIPHLCAGARRGLRGRFRALLEGESWAELGRLRQLARGGLCEAPELRAAVWRALLDPGRGTMGPLGRRVWD